MPVGVSSTQRTSHHNARTGQDQAAADDGRELDHSADKDGTEYLSARPGHVHHREPERLIKTEVAHVRDSIAAAGV